MRLAFPLILAMAAPLAAQTHEFSSPGYTDLGEWRAEAAVTPSVWQPGDPLRVTATLHLSEGHLKAMQKAGFVPESFVMLVTAERTFDAGGRLRLGSDERMSTLLTPTGLAIEGGVQGAVTNRFGYGFRTPVDQLVTGSVAGNQDREVRFEAGQILPLDLPPGIYRVRLDFGVYTNRRYYNLNGDSFPNRPFFKGKPTESHMYSPPVRASGTHVSGRRVDAATIRPRVPWVLLYPYNSNGYSGVVADEDQPYFALSNRNIIPDDVILPLVDAAGRKLSYSLEPQFPTDTIELRNNIPWDFTKGEYSVQITNPDGSVTDLGRAAWLGKAGQYPTTKRREFTAWRPPAYGRYTVRAAGWIADIWGNRYEGGGTYHFWIANRMTLFTATFQGMAYPVGGRYGRDTAFAPAVPADVECAVTLYVNSDPENVRTATCKGQASPSGVFTAAQGLKQLPLDAPGEYHAKWLARYTDKNGVLWVSTMRHAGIVYPEDSPIVARGKKIRVGGNYVDRGHTHFEGWIDPDGTTHLDHITFPYNPGDVILIASDGQGANKIEPVLMWEPKENQKPYDTRFQGVGNSNVMMQTSNGYSPHLFPEYITDWAYYYGAAPRPGFMSRFLVAENGVRAPYWPTSPNGFGGQINASPNGDMPGDIYRFIGGVALRRRGERPAYAGYIASGFILPKGSNNNRVVAPGAEDVPGPHGSNGRFFLVGTRPGMLYEAGTSFAAALQIDPILPVNVTFTLEYPDGRRVFTWGTGDASGTFVGKERWTLDVPGVYRFHIAADWQGHKGVMPGLPPDGGAIYVIEKERPAGAPQMKLDLPPDSTFNANLGLTVSGRTTAREVHYAAIIPGAVIEQGVLAVSNGRFLYHWSPKRINERFPTYDVVHRVTGAPDIKEVVHLTLFTEETAADGKKYHDFTRLILRGNRVLYAK
ncbi:MAG: hypothetical protein ACE15B_10140 [Bryobacteraceae bacterium]